MSFSLRLFGGASLEGPGGPLTGRATQRHRLALLALLASTSRGGVSRDKLIAYLWEDGTNERTRRSLSDSVYRINKALGVEAVVAVGDELRLDSEELPNDVALFRDALRGEQWERAVDAYSGPFLDGFHLPNALEFERWLTAQRDELARLHAGALESLAEQQAATGDVATAAATWHRRAALDPCNARVALRLMEAMEAAGNRAGALRHARLHARRLDEEFGTGPDPDVLALAERLRSRSTVAAAEGEPRRPSPSTDRTGRTDESAPAAPDDPAPGASNDPASAATDDPAFAAPDLPAPAARRGATGNPDAPAPVAPRTRPSASEAPATPTSRPGTAEAPATPAPATPTSRPGTAEAPATPAPAAPASRPGTAGVEPAGRGSDDPRAPERPPRRERSLRAGPLAGIGALTILAAWFGWSSLSAPAPPPPPSIAVLPFDDLNASDDGLYFADGVTEDVLTRLSMIEGFRVIARASVMSYRDSEAPAATIAEELGVRYLVQGSVRHSSDDVRITAQLTDTRTNANVWAQTYDRRLEDIFGVQSDIARRVAEALEAELGPDVAAQMDRAPTDDLAAYNLYLRGRYFWHLRTEAGLLQSAGFFEDAVARDQDFARAWAGVADAYAVLAFYDYLPPREAYPTAREAAQRALSIDESLAEAHASLGYITLYDGWDAEEGERSFRRAIALNPSYSVGHQWYANHLVATGRFPEAITEMSRARETNPLSLIANGALGWVYYYAGRFDEAVQQCDLALEMDGDWDLAHLWRGMALEELGRTEEAVVSLRRAVELSGGSGITTAALAHAYAGVGKTDQARALLAELLEEREQGAYRPSFEIAKVYVALGEPAEALRWLEQAYEEHSHSMVFLEVDPQLSPLAGYPAFQELVERVGLEG